MYERILVAVDGSDISTQALEEAIGLARLSGGSLRLIHAVDVTPVEIGFVTCAAYHDDVVPALRQGGRKLLDHAAARVMSEHLPVETALLENGDASLQEVVAAEALTWHADLVVMGTHGRRGVDRFLLGSGAESVARRCPVPVLMVRAATKQGCRNCVNCSGRHATGDQVRVRLA